MLNKTLTSLLFLQCFLLGAQLVTNGNQTPAQLVQNVLVGQGVTVSNVTFSGSPGAIGSFQAANTSLGIQEGIILTTGTISNVAVGPHGPNNRPDAGMNNNAPGFGPLTQIVGTSTFNASILEFDFVPQSDTVRFEYIFGSDEYPEFVNSQFNDVFAFFISGPGIAGTQNMAIIPGSNQAVAINNLNNGTSNNGPCTNCQFYVNNGLGTNAPFNTNPFFVQYDGFTTPLQAVSPVQCGQTYRLTIAIADVGDALYDSGIFLAANSLSSVQPVNVSYTLDSDPFGDGKTMAQGCGSATVTVTRTGAGINQPLGVPVQVSGTAVQGLDVTNIPSQINFNAGQTEVSFTIDALNNPDLTGTANLVMEFQIFDPCDNEDFQVIELFIAEVEDVNVDINYQPVNCPGDAVFLEAIPSGGGNGYNVNWSTGDTTKSITFVPTTSQNITVTISDNCLNQTVTETIFVEVPSFDDLEITITEDIVEQCPFVPFDLEVNPINGAGIFTFLWEDGNGNVLGTDSILSVNPSQTSTYFVTVNDQCGDTVSGQVTITILSPPLIPSISPDQEICPGDSALIFAGATGGFGDYYFLWLHSGETTDSIWVQPEETTTFTVQVRDDCQTFTVNASTEVVVVAPEADFQIVSSPLFEGLPVVFQNLTNNGNFYEWTFGDGNMSNDVHPTHTFQSPGSYLIWLYAEDLKGCRDSTFKVIRIQQEAYLYVPNAFTPDGDQFNSTFGAEGINIVQFEITIFNRWGEIIFESRNFDFEWDGTYKGTPVRNGVYPWTIRYRSVNDNEDVHLNGFVTVVR
jgi:gliding motility-associated-like protein